MFKDLIKMLLLVVRVGLLFVRVEKIKKRLYCRQIAYVFKFFLFPV